jgi:hypothetical protein
MRDLASQIALDVNMKAKQMRDIKAHVVTLVQQIVSFVDVYFRQPDPIQRVFGALTGEGRGGSETLHRLVSECVTLVPAMLKDDTDGGLHRIASRLLFQTLRLLRPQQEAESRMLNDLALAVAGSTSLKVRSAGPYAIGALLLLSRTQPQQSAIFSLFCRLYLEKENSTTHLMELYDILVEAICIQHGSLMLSDGDVSSLCVGGQVQLLHSAAEFIGSHTFWSIYWGLRRSQQHAVCRARYVLVSVLCVLDLSGSSTNQIALWTKVMSDPHPPTAMVGAQKIIRISGLSAYDKYEAAISEAQRAANPSRMTNAYTMAANIWERVEADPKPR